MIRQFSMDSEGNFSINNKTLLYNAITNVHSNIEALSPEELKIFNEIKNIIFTKKTRHRILTDFKNILIDQMQAVNEQNYKDKGELLQFYQSKIEEVTKKLAQYGI